MSTEAHAKTDDKLESDELRCNISSIES